MAVLGPFTSHVTRTLTKNNLGLFYPSVRKPISNSTYGGRRIRRGVTIGESIGVFQNTGLVYIGMLKEL